MRQHDVGRNGHFAAAEFAFDVEQRIAVAADFGVEVDEAALLARDPADDASVCSYDRVDTK
jgi:hypothetical protein